MSSGDEGAGAGPRRFPRGVYGQGKDPDVRFSLANERTYLAWVRTALALVAGAVAVQTPYLDLDDGARLALSLLLLAGAATCVWQAVTRWRRVERALRTGGPLPGFGGALVLAACTALLVVAVVVGCVVAFA